MSLPFSQWESIEGERVYEAVNKRVYVYMCVWFECCLCIYNPAVNLNVVQMSEVGPRLSYASVAIDYPTSDRCDRWKRNIK
jgi:hypothetical protein